MEQRKIERVIQSIVGMGLVLGAVVAGIALSPVIGLGAWVLAAFIGTVGGAMLIDGLKGSREGDRNS